MAVTQLFKSTDLNAPALTGQVGALTALLTTCLVNGYTPASVTSITRSGTTATATLASSDVTLVTGHYVRIAGAAQSDYNGDFQVTVTDSTHFTYQVANSPATPATGTITYARSPLGWTLAGTSTNAALYRQGAGSQFYLKITDNAATAGGAKEAQAVGCEAAESYAVNYRTFPTALQVTSGLCWRKSSTADATARAWTLAGDNRTFYLLMNDSGTTLTTNSYGFGDFSSYKVGDAYNCFICGQTSFNTGGSSNSHSLLLGQTYGGADFVNLFLARPFFQLGSAVTGSFVGPMSTNSVHGSSGIAFPNAPDGGTYLGPIFVQNSPVIRGRLRGWYAPMHVNPFVHYDTVTNVAGLSGVTLTALLGYSSSTAGQVLVDTFGPW